MKSKSAPDFTVLQEVAIDAAIAAGAVLMRYFGKRFQIWEKKGAGIVTSADIEAEAAALKILTAAYPRFGILAEEQGQKKARSPGRWIIDPLDGTTNFAHGFPLFCVSIAAEWEGEVAAGVIFHPVLNDLYVTRKGGGAFLNSKKIHVSGTVKLEDSLLTTGFTYRKEKWLHREMNAFERLSTIVRAIRRPGSAALDLAYTARGVFDGFWERSLSPWDIAAGILLVREAGGKVTDFKGKPSCLDGKELLASNPRLHPLLLQTIEPEFCPIV